MAGKDNSVKKYVVRLSAGEREHLRLLKARILLKADVSEAGDSHASLASISTSRNNRIRRSVLLSCPVIFILTGCQKNRCPKPDT